MRGPPGNIVWDEFLREFFHTSSEEQQQATARRVDRSINYSPGKNCGSSGRWQANRRENDPKLPSPNSRRRIGSGRQRDQFSQIVLEERARPRGRAHVGVACAAFAGPGSALAATAFSDQDSKFRFSEAQSTGCMAGDRTFFRPLTHKGLISRRIYETLRSATSAIFRVVDK